MDILCVMNTKLLHAYLCYPINISPQHTNINTFYLKSEKVS